jgi:hypothetical protein
MKQHPALKNLLLILIPTVFIIGLGIFSQQLLRRDSNVLKSSIDVAVKCAYTGNWKGAEDSLDEVAKTWSKVKGSWSALIDHEEIDNIDVTLSQLQTLVKAKELPDTLSEAAALKTYIGHIPEKEKLRLENLF